VNKKIKNIFIFLLVFSSGYITASFVAPEYFKNLYVQKTILPSNIRMSSDSGESIYIISPRNGDEVKNPVRIIFGLKNMGIAPAGIIKKNTGHHHLLININNLPDLKLPLPSNENLIHFGLGQTEAEVKLKKGSNTLQLILGNHMHIPHLPPLISKKIIIYVK
jgi:hypothetical protein